MIPLDSPIYDELETLNGLGYLDTYFEEIKPIARVEAARLTLEAEHNMSVEEKVDPLAIRLTKVLEEQLSEEVGWLNDNREDNTPPLMGAVDRVETQYVFSRGVRRFWRGTSDNDTVENTPLMQNADGIPTASGSNEIVRASGWIGAGNFLTLQGEGAIAGPVTRQVYGQDRAIPIEAESIVSLGNSAISFGLEEKRWGEGYFAPLSQGANAQTFPALTWQNVHPKYLPSFLRYLGPGRRQVFFGQLDPYRPYAQHPWTFGHILVFKPLPWFQFGWERVVMFGGRNNDHYDFNGFLERAFGLSTNSGQTHNRAGLFLRITAPRRFRGVQIYQEILGEDNLYTQVPGIGRFLPFLAVSYQGGIFLPRLTEDGLTDARFEYSLIEPVYSTHNNGLYSVYQNQTMGDPIGPNSTQINLNFDRWVDLRYRLGAGVFYTEQAPQYDNNNPYPAYFYGSPITKARSVGGSLDMLRLSQHVPFLDDTLGTVRGQVAVEYAKNVNYAPDVNSVRVLINLSVSLNPQKPVFQLQ